MEKHDTVIIGAGQAGLAASYFLKQHNHEHVILEKSRVGEAWRSSKWDSFTLVTPNWMVRLPGHEYDGGQPDGFMHRNEVVQYLDDYVAKYELPVRSGVEVKSVAEQAVGGFRLETSQGPVLADNVVVATGTFQQPRIPHAGMDLSSEFYQVHSSEYRNPAKLPEGAVLVVGSAQSGCQIADELNDQGREVFLCTGSADRLPRKYRGQDSFWWAAQLGLFDQTVEDLPSREARFNPNPQVTGKDGGKYLSLHHLAADGVKLLGRLKHADGKKVALGADLEDNLKRADKFEAQFKKGVDTVIEQKGLNLPENDLPELKAGYDIDIQTELDLQKAGVNAIVWATGYKYDYSWVNFPVFDEVGYPITERGATRQPGLYFLGLHWLHTRESGLLSGVGKDAQHVAEHIASK